MGLGKAAEIEILNAAPLPATSIWLDSREGHRRRRKHADNQNAQHDVIGQVHGIVPAMSKVACTRAINVTEQRDRTPRCNHETKLFWGGLVE